MKLLKTSKATAFVRSCICTICGAEMPLQCRIWHSFVDFLLSNGTPYVTHLAFQDAAPTDPIKRKREELAVVGGSSWSRCQIKEEPLCKLSLKYHRDSQLTNNFKTDFSMKRCKMHECTECAALNWVQDCLCQDWDGPWWAWQEIWIWGSRYLVLRPRCEITAREQRVHYQGEFRLASGLCHLVMVKVPPEYPTRQFGSKLSGMILSAKINSTGSACSTHKMHEICKICSYMDAGVSSHSKPFTSSDCWLQH